ncbi:XdhC family protein, partial [Pseudooctadecabacter sp.]|uniref:XdhC family protein n=1 Tax=Pseudooctadecabacter sp. TaxID=1966338 RepID=UPI0025EB5BEC
MSDRRGLPGRALEWHRAGRPVAVATVVETWGSAPRPVGSQLVIDGEGRMEGSVSGGCVEGAVIVEALEAMEDGRARLLDYGVSDDEAFAVGLACGGQIRVMVEPVGGAMPVAVLEDLANRRAAGDPVAYVADLVGKARRLEGPATYPDRFRLDRSGVEPDGRTFVAIHNPPLRMVVVGGVHIAQHLLPMARACGYDVTLVDPRPAFGSPERFPDTVISDDWPDEALQAMGLDARTAVVTLTHDPKLDDPAIEAALQSPVFYLGCLGSTRTHAKRVARLQAAGFGEDNIARIHAPVGLDIG